MNSLQEYRTPLFENAQVLSMDEVPEYTEEDYDLFNPKEFKKYINDIERLVRSSREYRKFTQYLRQYMDMSQSFMFENINSEESSKIRIELHHYPFTLYDIVLTVYNKRTAMGEPLEVELVAKEVAYIHYFLYVGLVPLTKTEHLLFHNQSLVIPIDVVLGRYDQFIEMYSKYIPEDAMERYKLYQEMSKNYTPETNASILSVSPTLLKLPGADVDGLGAYSRDALQNALSSTQDTLYRLTSKNSYFPPVEDKKMVKPFTYDKAKTLE